METNQDAQIATNTIGTAECKRHNANQNQLPMFRQCLTSAGWPGCVATAIGPAGVVTAAGPAGFVTAAGPSSSEGVS